jgi:hypothetical protein
MTSEFVLNVSAGKKNFQIDDGQCLDRATSTNCHIATRALQHESGLLICRFYNRSGQMLGESSFAQ